MSYLLEPLINQREAIVDHPQEEEEEEEDLTKEEEEVMDVKDSPKMIKMKKRENHLTSQRLSVVIVRRWVISQMNVIQIRRRNQRRICLNDGHL